MWEPYRDIEELGEVRKHGAVKSVRRGSEEVGIVPEQDGQGLQVPEEVEEEVLLGLICNTFQVCTEAPFQGCVNSPPLHYI